MFTRLIVSGFILFFGIFLFITNESFGGEKPVFRFDVLDEPSSLYPSQIDAGTHGYIVGNLFLTLFKHENGKSAQPYLAKSCRWIGHLKLDCALDPKFRFSDGSAVRAEDVVHSFRQVISPDNKSKEAHQLFRLLNAKEIYAQKMPPEKLGVLAKNDVLVEFSFSEPDSEFVDRLSHTAFSVIKSGSTRSAFTIDKANSAFYSGPYQLSKWEAGKRIILEPNPFFTGHENRPRVEALFISDDQAAYRLFEKGDLELLRKIPVALVPISEKRSEFFKLPVLRFDYFGFSAKKYKLFEIVEARSLLAQALNYDESDNIFGYKAGKFGCAGLTEDFTSQAHCLKFEPILLSKASGSQKEAIEAMKKDPPRFVYSSQGGEFNRITADWLQAQWKTNLGFSLNIESRESKVFSEEVKTSPPPIFLRRVGMDRATCLAALENFESDSNTNYVTYRSREFDQVVKKLRDFNLSAKRKKQLCEKGLALLIQRDVVIIPTGQYALTLLISKKAKGFRLNDLNQLDLTNLIME